MPKPSKRCLVTIPAYGDDRLTHSLIPSIRAEADLVDLLIVDNSGSYAPLGDEWVIRPATNIGWARASNLGFRTAFSRGYQCAITLNNDTELSPGFFAGMLDTRMPDDAGIVGPMYNDRGTIPAQTSDYLGPAAGYQPHDFIRRVSAIDGTALLITLDAWLAAGDLDYRSFGRFNWGSEMDLSIRVREAGFGVYLTERSYLNHQIKASAASTYGRRRYFVTASYQWKRGMRRLHGPGEIKRVKAAPVERIALSTPPAP